MDEVKLPWYVDLLNINLDNHDLTEAKRRIRLLADAFRKDGTRITENRISGRSGPRPSRHT
jgi:malate synthase